jgi:hypothetical protein
MDYIGLCQDIGFSKVILGGRIAMVQTLRGKRVELERLPAYQSICAIGRKMEARLSKSKYTVDEHNMIIGLGGKYNGCYKELTSDNNETVVVDYIRGLVLSRYAEDLTDEIILLFYFYDSYGKLLKRLNSMNCTIAEISTVFDEYVKGNLIKNKETILLTDGTKEKEIIKYHERMYAFLKKADSTLGDVDVLRIEKMLYEDVVYLKLIDEKTFNIDNIFLQKWKYYAVDKLYQNTLEALNCDEMRSDYVNIKQKEFKLYNSLLSGKFRFTPFNSKTITTDTKVRNVLYSRKSKDRFVQKYLSNRLKDEYEVSFPNRDKIMLKVFPLVDSIVNLDEYTILRFDIEDFFDSVDGKHIFDKYVKNSNLKDFEKKLIFDVIKMYGRSPQGISFSNVLIEIAAKRFDVQVRSVFEQNGLILYERYVDDGILIFNRKVSKEVILEKLKVILKEAFGKGVEIHKEKTVWQTKYEGEEYFDYLGYRFGRVSQNGVYYTFGISEKKIKKYREKLEEIFKRYDIDHNERLLLHRIKFYNSRIVFYNYNSSKYSARNTWRVIGFQENYKLLQKYIIQDDCIRKEISKNRKEIATLKATGKNCSDALKREKKLRARLRVQTETYDFMRNGLLSIRTSRKGMVPSFLLGNGVFELSIWKSMVRKKTIVFQPNIGWSDQYLEGALIDIGATIPPKSSYHDKVEIYCKNVYIKQ